MSKHLERTSVDTESLKTLIDLAVKSLDAGSGFWDIEDWKAVHRVALDLGTVDEVTMRWIAASAEVKSDE